MHPFRALRLSLITSICLLAMSFQAMAQTIIRDAEIEQGLRELAAPVLRAAGLPLSINIIVLDDSGLNAFVADARNIFITSGLLMRMEDPSELQAVIAHEAAHIANGHLTRRPAAARNAGTAARLGLILGLITAGTTGNAQAGAGMVAGSMASAQRVFFAHTRAEEASADQSALRYLTSAGIDPAAMARVLMIFRGQEALSVGRQDPYVRTHPLTRDRLRAVEAFGQSTGMSSDETARYWFARTTGKLSAFLRAPSWTLRRVDRNATDEISTLRRAIAYHRQADTERALQEMNRLLQARPNDPFYQELQGQILFEGRRFPDAVRAYARAVQLAPREALILAGYGRALLAADTTSGNREALSVLESAFARDSNNPRMLRDLAMAYARAGQNGMASAITAERYAMLGQMDSAQLHATRASGLLPRGSTGWLRAQDVLRVAQDAQDRR